MNVVFTLNDVERTKRDFDPLIEHVGGRTALEAMAAGVRSRIFDHLTWKNSFPNKNGWPKTNFYAQAAESMTTVYPEDGSADVVIAKTGFAQRYYGGPIRPVNAKALTIPISPMAYGKRASEFGKLVFLPIKSKTKPNTVGMLFLPLSTRSKAGRSLAGRAKTAASGAAGAKTISSRLKAKTPAGNVLLPLFVLSKGVQQAPDVTVVPGNEALVDAAFKALWDAYQFKEAQAGGEANP